MSSEAHRLRAGKVGASSPEQICNLLAEAVELIVGFIGESYARDSGHRADHPAGEMGRQRRCRALFCGREGGGLDASLMFEQSASGYPPGGCGALQPGRRQLE